MVSKNKPLKRVYLGALPDPSVGQHKKTSALPDTRLSFNRRRNHPPGRHYMSLTIMALL